MKSTPVPEIATADDVSPELGSFLNYIAGRNTCGQFVGRLESAVEKRADMMNGGWNS
ncbi:MAG: hypothetical protein IJS22_04245 [Lachnospiraceae bacterium]|nr:hypothetical protein [Lachnospiraceae bacterium]